MKREDLVALIYADNECYTSVVSLEEVDQRRVWDGGDRKYWNWPKLVIDLENETWQQEGKGKPVKIGEGYVNDRHKYGLIGIYDRTNIEHLNHMNFDTIDATRDSDSGYD